MAMRKGVDAQFVRQVGTALALMAGLAAWPLARYGSPDVVRAVLAGAALSTLNVLVGYAAVEYAFPRSFTTFLKVVLGGMGIRMLVMLGAMVVMIKVFHVHAVALTASLLGTYAVFLLLEVLFIQKKIGSQHERTTT